MLPHANLILSHHDSSMIHDINYDSSILKTINDFSDYNLPVSHSHWNITDLFVHFQMTWSR